jgi:hypothetical protein
MCSNNNGKPVIPGFPQWVMLKITLMSDVAH